MTKQIPMLAIRVVSRRPIATTARMERGTTSMPTTRSAARKPASASSVVASAPADRPAPVATAVSAAMNTIAIRSSTRRIPTTSSRSRPPIRSSSNTLAMIVVLEIATIAPVKTDSSGVQPNARAARKPSIATIGTSVTAVIPAVGPTCASLPRLNSSPSENISSTTPSSESVRTIPGSATIGIGTCGPTITPAST